MESLSPILNVIIVILLIWLMFGILGLNLMRGKLGYCDGTSNIYGVNKEYCVGTLGKEWKIYDTNFENIHNALITLFIATTLENWPGIMY